MHRAACRRYRPVHSRRVVPVYQEMPAMPDEFVHTISERYIELYERITGLTFQKADTENIVARIEHNVNAYLQNS